ncbi:DEAD/DEAH box helicase [Cytobacillus sp. Hm23]
MRFLSKQGLLTPEPLVLPPNHERARSIRHATVIHTPILNTSFNYSKQLQQLLAGKQTLLCAITHPIEQIHEHYKNGYVSYTKGIAEQRGLPTCARCGNNDKYLFGEFDCTRCQESCTYCRKCIQLGRISSCTALIHWLGPINAHVIKTPLQWTGTLSKGQQVASQRVVQAITNNKDLLVWAVCGAGKTEVLFHGIEAALQTGKSVCIATPRTDVVLELAPRMRSAFPQVEVIALYGGSEDRGKIAPITITTTHQLLRYYQAFDIVIIDEVDAFPYSIDPMLQYAVQQAKKPTSPIIYLTATPSKKWQREILSNRRDAVTIPARYHGFSLPLPTFQWCGDWRKLLQKKRLPKPVLSWLLNHLTENKQALLFVPHIEALSTVVQLLKHHHSKIEGVHANDVTRKEKVSAFRDRSIPILVTTTILERGITIPNINVAVLGAEDRIFTESALVQIAGRVGRSAKHPTGEIRLFHFGKTKAMLHAKRHIAYMNAEGKRMGLLHRG